MNIKNINNKTVNTVGTVGNIMQGISGGTGLSTTGGSILGTAGSIASAIPGVGTLVGGALQGLGAITDMAFGSSINDAAVANYEDMFENMRNTKANTSSTSSMIDQINNFDWMDSVSMDDVGGKDGWFSNKASNTVSNLNRQLKIAREKAWNTLEQGATTASVNNNMDKMASFYELGGNLYTNIPNIGQHGGIFSNGIISINEGGTHNENPLGGIPMGMSAEGIPNLVEEGEVKYKDYIFSNKLLVPKDFKTKYKLKGNTYAEVVKYIQKESDERPNDPISKAGLEDFIYKLQTSQEEMRARKQTKTQSNIFEDGGPISNLKDLDFINKSKNLELPIHNIDYDRLRTSTSSITNLPGTSIDIKDSLLRYAPVVGSGISALSHLLDSPDFSIADTIQNSTNNLVDMQYKPITQRLEYNPLDRNYTMNKLSNASASNRQAIVNNSQGNRSAALAGLLSQGYNELQAIGDINRQTEEYNNQQKERVATFNRGTDSMNRTNELQVANYNRDNELQRINSTNRAASIRQSIADQYDADKSLTLSSLFENLGLVGHEQGYKNMVKWMNDKGIHGVLPTKQ